MLMPGKDSFLMGLGSSSIQEQHVLCARLIGDNHATVAVSHDWADASDGTLVRAFQLDPLSRVMSPAHIQPCWRVLILIDAYRHAVRVVRRTQRPGCPARASPHSFELQKAICAEGR